MEANKKLLEHPFWEVSNPSQMRLVRVFELPSYANPFFGEGVVLKVAAGVGEVPNHKAPMAREGILDGIRKGLIQPDTIVVEGTSGNTGAGMADTCNKLGLRFKAIVSNDVPSSKLDVIRALGDDIGFGSPEKGETTVDCARRLGAQPGWYNPDQYAGDWNPMAHYKYMAPQLFEQTKVSVFVTPGGTMGTSIGIDRYARNHKLSTKVVPVMCAEGQEVPAARTLARVKRDILFQWEECFPENEIEFATRYASFLLSYLSWRLIPAQLGPSFGLAFVGALKFLRKHRNAGTLDQFRHPDDGQIHVVVFGADDYRPYIALYLALHLYEGKFARGVPKDMLEVIDLA